MNAVYLRHGRGWLRGGGGSCWQKKSLRREEWKTFEAHGPRSYRAVSVTVTPNRCSLDFSRRIVGIPSPQQKATEYDLILKLLAFEVS